MLKNIKMITCPKCGCAEIVKEYVDVENYNKPKVHQHTNGTRWEHRAFLCGFEVIYEPNFKRETINNQFECFYDHEVIARKEKEIIDKASVLELLTKNNISERLINKIKLNCL